MMRRLVLAVAVGAAAWLAPAALAGTSVRTIVGSMADPFAARGDAMQVLADGFFPPGICNSKAHVYFRDSSGHTWNMGDYKPDFSADPQGELYVYAGDVPQTAAFGAGALHVTQHCHIGKTSGKAEVDVLDTTGPAPTVTSIGAGDGVSEGKVPLTFTLDRGAGVSVSVEWEFLPGDWQPIDQPVYFHVYMQAGTYNYTWKADAGGPIPGGHYRFILHVRRLDVTPDESTGAVYTKDFFVADEVAPGTLFSGGGSSTGPNQEVAVADMAHNDLQLFEPYLPSAGSKLATFLQSPTSVSYSADGFFYVLESNGTKVARLTGVGEQTNLFSVGAATPRSPTPVPPAPIAASSSIVYVGAPDGTLALYTTAGHQIVTVAKSTVHDPGGVAIAPDGTAWVAQASGFVHIGTAGQALGTIAFPKPGTRIGPVVRGNPIAPRALALMHSGVLIVADSGSHDVLLVTPGNSAFVPIGGSVLRSPLGITSLGDAGDFYVVDGTHLYHFRIPQ